MQRARSLKEAEKQSESQRNPESLRNLSESFSESESFRARQFRVSKHAKTVKHHCTLNASWVHPPLQRASGSFTELQRASEASERGYSARKDLSQKLFIQIQQGYKEISSESFRELQSAATGDIEKLS